jgi:hypothetical protein
MPWTHEVLQIKPVIVGASLVDARLWTPTRGRPVPLVARPVTGLNRKTSSVQGLLFPHKDT